MIKDSIEKRKPEQVELTAVLEYYSDEKIKRFFNYSGPGSGMPKTYEEVLSALEMCVVSMRKAVPGTMTHTGFPSTVGIRIDSDIVLTMPESGTIKQLMIFTREGDLPKLIPFHVHIERRHAEKGDTFTCYIDDKSTITGILR